MIQVILRRSYILALFPSFFNLQNVMSGGDYRFMEVNNLLRRLCPHNPACLNSGESSAERDIKEAAPSSSVEGEVSFGGVHEISKARCQNWLKTTVTHSASRS